MMLYQSEYTHGGDIYSGEIILDFSVNTNPFGPPEGVRKVICGTISQIDRYPDPYCRKAVKAISDHEGVPQNHILLGNGAAELIFSFCNAVKPKSALEFAPTFSEYGAAVKMAGGRSEKYLLKRDDSFSISPCSLNVIEGTDAEVFFLCYPNNPTGRFIDPVLLREILQHCYTQNIRLVLDECFMDLTGYKSDMNSLLETYPNLIILKALTKNYALAGIRLGYCLSADTDLLRAMSRTVQPWNVSVIAQAAAIAALQEKDYLKKTTELIRQERNWLKTSLESFGFWVCPSDANFLLFQAPSGLDTALRKEKIAIRNCSDFTGLGPGWYRTAVRQHSDNLTLIKTIGAIIEKDK